MPEERIKVHFTPGDGKGWALDEDLRQIRASLTGMIRESGVAGAEVIHAPFWQNLGMVAPDILRRAFVIAHADNPPFFYLKQPEFLAGQQQVDLWVARSREAFGQFEALGLPAVHIPYTIDPGLFFPIEDKAGLRREFGIPVEAYVLANFHRDTEGADLKMPKVQKNPEFMMAILRRLKERGVTFHVLLAGPRRHWIREALSKEGMPFTFVGEEVEGDDFGTNILDRATLNRLYNAADLYLIPSRWEGGPQSAMEAAACRCKILSVPIGVGRDILESKSLFRSSAEAAQRLEEDICLGLLDPTVQPQFARWQSSHTTSTLKQGLQKLYQRIPSMDDFRAKQTKARPIVLLSAVSQILFTIRRRISRPTLPAEISWNHQAGSIAELDRIMRRVETMLHDLGIPIRKDAGAAIEIIGSPRWRNGVATRFQCVVPGIAKDVLLPDAFLISPSVQDVLNLRSAGCRQPAITIPFLESMEKQSEQPCVIAQGNRDASLQVWEALVEGRPVIYPENSAYYEQVFHAGHAYGNEENPESLTDQARQMSPEFRELRYLPSLRTSASLLGALLRSRNLS
jgi:glycosyltransferase involved in cell wall biosynthesis